MQVCGQWLTGCIRCQPDAQVDWPAVQSMLAMSSASVLTRSRCCRRMHCCA